MYLFRPIGQSVQAETFLFELHQERTHAIHLSQDELVKAVIEQLQLGCQMGVRLLFLAQNLFKRFHAQVATVHERITEHNAAILLQMIALMEKVADDTLKVIVNQHLAEIKDQIPYHDWPILTMVAPKPYSRNEASCHVQPL